MKKKSKGRIILKCIGIVLLAVVIIAFAAVMIINGRYTYVPVSTNNILADGEKGVLTVFYGGADGMPERETIEYSKNERIELPELTKKGYKFSGWSAGWLFSGSSVTLNTKTATARPQFDKDYSMIKSAAALYTQELTYEEYREGEYPAVNKEIVDMYLDGGYKMTVYSEPDFAGEETKVYYTGMFSGFVGSMKIEAVKTQGVEIPELTDEARYELLTMFAPRIWWDEDEEFFASTIEYAKEHMTRAESSRGYMYYLEGLDKPTYMTDYLYGQKDGAKAYAFAVEKEYKYLDLSYFIFTSYNKAKEVLGIQFGNHIGDWEHVTVRLMNYTENGKNYYRPVIVDYSAHSFRNYVSWDEIEIVDETHPVAYTAQGSHGMWKDAGTHVYVDAVIIKLTDECSQGTEWDLWLPDQMETYSYDALTHTGKGIGESEWSTAFDLDYLNENSDCISSWGNNGWYAPIQIYPQLQGGPGGPQQKNVLNDYYTLNNKITG